MDIQNVTCASGKMIGKRVSSLSEFWQKKIVMKGYTAISMFLALTFVGKYPRKSEACYL